MHAEGVCELSVVVVMVVCAAKCWWQGARPGGSWLCSCLGVGEEGGHEGRHERVCCLRQYMRPYAAQVAVLRLACDTLPTVDGT